VTEGEILGDAQIGATGELLMHHGNARSPRIAGCREADAVSPDVDRPTVRLMDARQNFAERGFSRAVFAHQGVHLAARKRQRHAIKRRGAPEGFRDIVDVDEWIHWAGSTKSFQCRKKTTELQKLASRELFL
jgi:hypothetical protein